MAYMYHCVYNYNGPNVLFKSDKFLNQITYLDPYTMGVFIV